MVKNFDHPSGWNIFARELEKILDVRRLQFKHLDTHGIVDHREKVRRLKQSLTSPKHLTTLNPNEMERLITKMQLTALEQVGLIAALLATAVEMTLMDRVESDVALTAANDVFVILFAAMKDQPDMGMTKHVKGGPMVDDDDTFGDALFLEALDLIDRATLSLHASKNATTPQARTTHAHEALAAFTRTLDLLHQSGSPEPESEGWQGWYNEAVEGRRMAQMLVQATKEEE